MKWELKVVCEGGTADDARTVALMLLAAVQNVEAEHAQHRGMTIDAELRMLPRDVLDRGFDL